MHKLVSSTLVALCATVLLPHPAGAQGQAFYESRCVLCHGADGTGSDRAGSILARAATLSTDRLAAIITEGVPARGMPAILVPADEMGPLVSYLKGLVAAAGPAARDPRAPRPRSGSFTLADGTSLAGTMLNESGFDAQLRTADGVLHLLRKEGDRFQQAAIEPYVDWNSYNGDDSSNRHSAVDQIDRNNVDQLTEWETNRRREPTINAATPTTVQNLGTPV